LDSKLIDICYQKYNKKINLSWSEIASQYYKGKNGEIGSGEALRSKFKKYRKANDVTNKSFVDNDTKDIVNNLIIGDGDRELIIPAPPSSPNYKESTEFKQDGSQISDKLIAMSLEESKDPEFVLKSHGYSPDEWIITSAKNSMWHMNTKAYGIRVLYSSKISVKPRTEYKWNETDAKKIFSNLKTDTSNKINIKPLQYKENGKLLILPICDFHLNLLSDNLSTGNEYNMEIAEDIFYYVINDVIDRVKGKTFEKVLFVVGNDFVTADNLAGTTTRGTPQETANSWFKAVNKATELIVEATDMLTEIAPTEVILVPSNHDLHTMFGVMQTVSVWYKDDKNVKVDVSPLPRKYYEFGKTLLTFSHDIKVKDALQIITSEAKDMWSNCKHMILMLGHLHQAMVYEKQGYLEVLRLPCISGFSRWSNDKGYIQSEKKNQSFIIDGKLGITDIMNTVINNY